MDIKLTISRIVEEVLVELDLGGLSLHVRRSKRSHFGDYQVDGVARIAREINLDPHRLAENIARPLRKIYFIGRTEITSSGFINIFLDRDWMAHQISQMNCAPNLGIESDGHDTTVVVDYSSPNLGKEMHIGHMRSTIMGDVHARSLELVGCRVIRANHVGDWGFQFGMIIAYLEVAERCDLSGVEISDVNLFYRRAKRLCEEDPKFLRRARRCVAELQNGDERHLSVWSRLVEVTMRHNREIYRRLGSGLTDSDVMGESSYKSMLPDLVSDLERKNLVVDVNGTKLVFLEEFRNKNDEVMGVVIQREDGTYPYAATDLACLRYRHERFGANRVVYYVDLRQRQHLRQVELIARRAGYIPSEMIVEHNLFGMILDADGKPFRTRSGDNIGLTELLDEALKRAKELILSKKPDVDRSSLESMAEVLGIGAVKYSDLSKSREKSYVFDWNSMLNFDGNTLPYVEYAHSRIVSVLAKSRQDRASIQEAKVILGNERETRLAADLLQFPEIVNCVAGSGRSNVLCNYLHKIATRFSELYENDLVLDSEDEITSRSRLQLLLCTVRLLRIGLGLLGIDVLDNM